MVEKTIYTAKNDVDVKRFGDLMKLVLTNELKVKSDGLDGKELQDIGFWLKDPKLTPKEAKFTLSYDGKMLSSFVRVGGKSVTMKEAVDYLAITLITYEQKVRGLEYLISKQVATQAQLKAYTDKQAQAPLKKQIDDLEKKIKDAEEKIKPDRAELTRLKAEYKSKGGK